MDNYGYHGRVVVLIIISCGPPSKGDILSEKASTWFLYSDKCFANDMKWLSPDAILEQ